MNLRSFTRVVSFAVAAVVPICPAVSLARTPPQIGREIQAIDEQIDAYPQGVLTDPRYRKFIQEKIAPMLRHKVELCREIGTADSRAKYGALYAADSTLAILAVNEDADAAQTLEKDAGDSDKGVAECAKLGQAMRDWWATPTEDNQRKVLDQLIGYAQAAPKDDFVARTFVTLADSSPATMALASEARRTAAGLQGNYANEYRLTPNKIGWPLMINGTTVDGRPFSSSQWKGKVVVVDFWATWCGPCRQLMPRMIELYNKYHNQGLEYVGVSNDQDRSALVEFLQSNRAMVWPQLFGPSSSQQHWHAMAERFQIHAIPTVYLIDRSGILRTIMVGREPDEELKKLMEETADPALADSMKPIILGPASKPKPVAEKPMTAAPEPVAAPVPPAKPEAAPVSPTDDPLAKATRTLNLARSYINAERYDTAREKLQSIITQWPDTPPAKQAASLLKEIEGK